MKITNYAVNYGADIFYDPGFRAVLESHLPTILAGAKGTFKAVDPLLTYKYEGDLFGLFDQLNIPKQYHHITMLANRIDTTTNFVIKNNMVFVPDPGEIDLIKNCYTTRKNTF